MATPSTRTPIRLARGTYSNLNNSIADLQEGEIVYATDQNNLYVKEGSSLILVTTGLLDEDNMATNSATQAASQQSIKAYVDASSGGSVADDSLAEVKLDISNAPSDGYFLQYKDSSDQLTWAVPTDTNTTYSVVDASANGLAPQLPGAHGGKFLKADGSWEVPPDTNTQIAIDDTPVNGVTSEAISSNWAYDHNAATGNSAHVPAAGSSGQFLKHDGTWGTPPDTNTQRGIDDTPVNGETSESITSNWAYDHNAATGNSAHVPAAGSSGQFLKHDGTWGTPPDTNTQVAIDDTPVNGVTDEAISSNWAYDHNAATGNSAHVPAAGSSGEFLAHNGAWATPADATKMPLAGGTFTGAVEFEDKVTQDVTAVGALEIDCSAGNYFTKAITGNSTFTFANIPTSGNVYGMVVEVDVTGTSTTISWPAAVKWPSNTAPTLTDTKTHVFSFVTVDAGTTWRGSSAVDYVT